MVSRLILASSSPRRKILLENAGYKPDIILQPNVNEIIESNKKPKDIVRYLSKLKASSFSNLYKNDLIISADTIVAKGNLIIGKPKNQSNAQKILKMLSGRRHSVYTGVCIFYRNEYISRVEETKLKFKPLSNEEISFLLKSNEWNDKSGGYAIQGIASRYITWINGSYSNVMGLPMHTIYKILNGIGF